MTTTSPILSEVQNQTFANTAKLVINGSDFAYRGFSLEENAIQRTTFTLDGTEAIKNKVMLWLVSSYGDYVREPEKGGPLENLLGRTLTEENASFIRSSMGILFATFFQGDLNLMEAIVEPDKQNRRWKITLLVQDPVRRELFDIAVGVSS